MPRVAVLSPVEFRAFCVASHHSLYYVLDMAVGFCEELWGSSEAVLKPHLHHSDSHRLFARVLALGEYCLHFPRGDFFEGLL